MYLFGVKRLLKGGLINVMSVTLLTAIISVFLVFEMFNVLFGLIASDFAAFSFGNYLRPFPAFIVYFSTFYFLRFEVLNRLACYRFSLLSVLLVALHFAYLV